MIEYYISLEQHHLHYINVKMVISKHLTKHQEFWLPDWIPGSYMIRDFSRNIVSLSAKSNEQSVSLTKNSKSSWLLDESVDSLELEYKIYAWDLSVRSAHVDDLHCFFNGTSVFLAARGLEKLEHKMIIAKPESEQTNQWRVATSMPASQIDVNGFGLYVSTNYEDLIDFPVEIADFTSVDFIINGIDHQMVFVEAPKGIDLQRIASDVSKICQFECDFFGDQRPPFESFLFMTFVQKRGFGGLEHLSSTALHCSHDDLPLIGDSLDKKSKDYQKFLSLCSHEYFHCWNVKRIKPACFQPLDLSKEKHTELLWFFEGITSYYDELFLLRSGLINKEEYLEMLAKNITRYLNGSGRLNQSIADSSFDAWTKFYKQDENAPNAIVSYYVKGGLVAMCLDFKIRELTSNKKNLDDLMRLVWLQFGSNSKGVEEKGIMSLAESITNRCMKGFFNHLLYSTEELDLAAIFTHLNISYQLVSPVKQSETGGYRDAELNRPEVCSLRITHKVNSVGAEIISVFESGAAAAVGLSNKDIIIALDDIRVESSELDKRIARYVKGSNVKISFFRREKLHHRQCELHPAENSVCYLSFIENKSNQVFEYWAQTQQLSD